MPAATQTASQASLIPPKRQPRYNQASWYCDRDHFPSSTPCPGAALYLSVALLNNSSCCASSSASDKPLFSILLCFLSRLYSAMSKVNKPIGVHELTACCFLKSSTASVTGPTYSGNPSSFRAAFMCSGAMVFLPSFSAISLASEEMREMNSMQHSPKRSRNSFVVGRPSLGGMISLMIL